MNDDIESLRNIVSELEYDRMKRKRIKAMFAVYTLAEAYLWIASIA